MTFTKTSEKKQLNIGLDPDQIEAVYREIVNMCSVRSRVEKALNGELTKYALRDKRESTKT